LSRYPQEALQNGGIGVDTTPVVSKNGWQRWDPN